MHQSFETSALPLPHPHPGHGQRKVVSLEMPFKVWWEDLRKAGTADSTRVFGLYSWVPRGRDFTQYFFPGVRELHWLSHSHWVNTTHLAWGGVGWGGGFKWLVHYARVLIDLKPYQKWCILDAHAHTMYTICLFVYNSSFIFGRMKWSIMKEMINGFLNSQVRW